MTKFQLIVTGIFGFFLVLGVIIFSTYRGGSEDASEVVVWGTMSELAFKDILQSTSLFQNKLFNIKYTQKLEADFDASFIEALASGNGPDLFFLPSDKILKHYNKIFLIPYDVYTERQFKDSFIEGAEIYMSPKGLVGLPVYTNPLVMYWNRALFIDAKLTEPPKYWDEFYNLANLMSEKDGALNILKSAVSFGEFANISHAKEIIINLAMQAGTPVTTWSEDGAQSVFNFSFNKPTIPAEAAVNFFTEFGNPSKPSYSWNRSLPNSTNYFLGGDLALYFGFASEVRNLQVKNPNLNFDVAPIPVSRDGGVRASYADFGALAITKSSKNINAAFAVASILSSKEGAAAFSQFLRLPSARRDLLANKPQNAYESVFRDSAIRAKGWLDPAPEESNLIFKNMIESITSGRARTTEAVSRAHREISESLVK